MITRLLSEKIKKSPKSILLLGPRQVGKSTLITSLKPDLVINLNDDAVFLNFKSNPNELREIINAAKYKTIFIDEIQRHPTLLNTIQTILDKAADQKIKFFVSGSSARKLKQGQANLLPGRIFAYELGPLCAAELDYKLDIKKALSYGCLPEPYLQKDSEIIEKLLSTYSGVYLREEIQAEALTRNLEGFSRFIMSAAENSGKILDYSKIAKQAKIDRKVCSRFYEILEDTLIASKIDVYNKTKADIVKRPRYYFFDTGVLNGLLNNFNVSNDRKGLLFEHLVVNQILASAKAKDKKINLTYFRTRAGFEVDLILELNQNIYAIEIKSGNIVSSDADKLEQFKNYEKKIKKMYLISPAPESRKIKTVTACSINTFLKEIGL